jgi:hypothetical protein
MANAFSKAETVMFDNVIEGFDDQLVIAKAASKFDMGDAQTQERNNDIIWRPMPYIAVTEDGFDQSSNFGDLTALSVPARIGYHKVVPKKLTSKDLRDPSQLANFGRAAKLGLASAVNMALFTKVALEGAHFIARTGQASGFDDLAEADAIFTEIGIPSGEDRKMFLSSRDYLKMAGDLAGRNGPPTGRSLSAYERASLGMIAGFETFKNDQSYRLTAATGGATTVNGADQEYTPVATSTAATGEVSNVDNRYSNLTIAAATYANIKAGDAFTIEGVNSVNAISKQDTGQLQTFRVISKPSSNVIRIAPALISGAGGTDAEREYQNVSATPANGAAITWLNTIDAPLNPFFVRDALELIPGSFVVDPDDGWEVLRATTELGLAITYTRQGEINDLTVKARWEVDFGANLLNPLMAGDMAFDQA